jgi:dipeptidase E
MKLLLTSAGLSNKSIIKALRELTGKPFDKLNLAFIPTAANIEKGDKGWLVKDLINCRNLGFVSIDIVDISAVPKDIWEPRLKTADILMFGGGNPFYLMHWMKKSGLEKILPELLERRVYVGISAGSMVTSPNLSVSTSKPLYYSSGIKDYRQEKALGFVNFHIRPHFNSPEFPKIRKEFLEKMAKRLKEPMYAIDDQTAIKVINDKLEIMSEGKYMGFNL